MIYIPHHERCRQRQHSAEWLTVNSDGNALGEDETISALEGGDLSELVELQVLCGNTLRRLSLDKLNVEAILLCDREESSGARVTLRGNSE